MVSNNSLHLEAGIGGYQYILVVVDHFTRRAAAYATPCKSERTAADTIFNDLVTTFLDKMVGSLKIISLTPAAAQQNQAFKDHTLSPSGKWAV